MDSFIPTAEKHFIVEVFSIRNQLDKTILVNFHNFMAFLACFVDDPVDEYQVVEDVQFDIELEGAG